MSATGPQPRPLWVISGYFAECDRFPLLALTNAEAPSCDRDTIMASFNRDCHRGASRLALTQINVPTSVS